MVLMLMMMAGDVDDANGDGDDDCVSGGSNVGDDADGGDGVVDDGIGGGVCRW